MALLKRWNDYWFGPAPLVDLAVCRIVIVMCQLLFLFGWLPPYWDFHAVFRELAALPDPLYDPMPVFRFLTLPLGWNGADSFFWGAWLYRPSVETIETVFWITSAAGISALFGWWTNSSLFIFAIGNVFMQSFIYSFKELHHPEAVIILAISILALSPAGKVLSVDDLMRRLQGNLTRRRFEVFDILTETSPLARWPLLLVRYMVVLMYLSAALSKVGFAGMNWLNGYTLQYYILQDALRWKREIGLWLGQYHTAAWMLSWITILFEATFFLVLICPVLAWLYIPLGVSLHTGIHITMRAAFLQLMAVYSAFIPWAWLSQLLSQRLAFRNHEKKPAVLFDGRCPLCIRSMTVLRYFDWFDRLTFLDFERDWCQVIERRREIVLEECRREMHVIFPDGAVRRGFFAFRELLWYLPPLWFLLILFYLPSASTIGPKLYALCASRRSKFRECSFETCSIHSNPK